MFPIKSLRQSGSFAFVNWLLIISNIAIFIYIWSSNIASMYYIDFGIVPATLGMPNEIIPFYNKIMQFFTYMFIHGGWFHLIFNIYFLYIFGDNVEAKLGHFKYFVVYILFGILSGVVYVFLSPTTGVPMVGASGAIAGVMGAYLVFFPTSKIKTLLIIIIFITVINIPAIIFIAIWFIFQLVGFLISYDDLTIGEGVAWSAHVGGFLSGIIFGIVMRISMAIRKNN